MVAQTKEGIRFFVYALCEPDGKTIRYIGVTANLRDRYLKHVGSPQCKSLRAWIKGLDDAGLVPSLVVLRTVRGISAGVDAEREEIERYSKILGDQLLNEKHTGKPRPKRRGMIEFGGRSMTANDWAAHLGISRQALNIRLNKHPVELALTATAQKGKSLDGTQWKKKPTDGVETITLDIDAPVGLSHTQRRERRRLMAVEFASCNSLEVVARHFGVTPVTVRAAVKEFSV